MVLVALLSIPLAVLVYAVRSGGSARGMLLVVAPPLVPLVLLGFTALAVQPGPWRNVVRGILIALAMVAAWGPSVFMEIAWHGFTFNAGAFTACLVIACDSIRTKTIG